MHLHIHKHTHAEVDSALVKYQCQHHTARMRDIPLRVMPAQNLNISRKMRPGTMWLYNRRVVK